VCVCMCENIKNWATVARPLYMLSVSNQMSVVQIAKMFLSWLLFSPKARSSPSTCILVTIKVKVESDD
jgi:hypothetical protein